MLLFLISLLVGGLVVGALGRLMIPGPNPMSIGMTILVGIGGSLIAGLVGYVLLGRPLGGVLSVVGAGLLVWLMQRNRPACRVR